MTRKTSIETYHAIRNDGLLSKLRFEVYDCLYQYGPLTQGEVWSRYFPGRQRHDVCPRFAELEARGVIYCVGERPCSVTGRNSMVWDVTNNLPVEPIKKKTKTELQIEQAIKKEREACASLARSAGAYAISDIILQREAAQ